MIAIITVRIDYHPSISPPQIPIENVKELPPNLALSSPQVIQLVQAMGDETYSMRELTELCGYTDLKHFREGCIKPALAENAIERLYADQPNHPKQKYRLTESAKKWKIQNTNSY